MVDFAHLFRDSTGVEFDKHAELSNLGWDKIQVRPLARSPRAGPWPPFSWRAASNGCLQACAPRAADCSPDCAQNIVLTLLLLLHSWGVLNLASPALSISLASLSCVWFPPTHPEAGAVSQA